MSCQSNAVSSWENQQTTTEKTQLYSNCSNPRFAEPSPCLRGEAVQNSTVLMRGKVLLIFRNFQASAVYFRTPFCSTITFIPFRLEYPPWGMFPADNQQTAEGGVPHVWHLLSGLSFYPQCLLSCHGATGVICCDARYILSNYLNANETFLLLSYLSTLILGDFWVQQDDLD